MELVSLMFFMGQGAPWEVKVLKGAPAGGRRVWHPSKNA
jgi:hypothetical protein